MSTLKPMDNYRWKRLCVSLMLMDQTDATAARTAL